MQGVQQPVRLELTTAANTSPLAIDMEESTEVRLRRLITENPVVIFSRPSCCMCHVMKNLLHTVGVHPTVIALDEYEIAAIPSASDDDDDSLSSASASASVAVVPTLFIGGDRVGGLESLVGLHLSGHLVPKLAGAGALSLPLWV